MRDEFPIFKKHPDWVYLDSAATAHKPRSVIDALTRFYAEDYATVHRAIYSQSIKAGEQYHATRLTAARFLNALPEEIIFTRGTTDVQGMSANDMYELNEQGLVEQLDYSKMPNAKNLLPSMKYAYGIGHIYSGKVVLYNPDLMPAPTGFADTLDPKHGNKLGIIDIQYQYTMMAAGLATTLHARAGGRHPTTGGIRPKAACRRKADVCCDDFIARRLIPSRRVGKSWLIQARA